MGTDYYHGEEFPCLFDPSTSFTAKCYIFFGNGILPASIIIYPDAAAVENHILKVVFPLLLNPIINHTDVLITVLGQLFNNTTLKWENHAFYEDYIFVAKDISVSAENKPSWTWSPNNRVGEPSTLTFSFTSPVDL